MDDEMMEREIRDMLPRRNDSGGSKVDPGSADFYVSSIWDASVLLQQNMTPKGARFRRQLVDYITNPDNRVLSECNAYHNFVMDLFRVRDYDLGLKVCDFALNMAPYNCDILGDAIRACGSSSQFEKGELYLKRAKEIPYEKWSFRLFLYCIDLLQKKLNAFMTDDTLYHDALDLAEKFIHYFPFDEHGYNKKAELLLLMNHRDEAISVLREYIFDVHPDKNNCTSELVTAQCCVTLLDILDDSSDYDFIIEICERGLRNTTQAQPSATIGFFMYRKALALDAKAHTEKFKVPDTVSDALRFYQAAYDLNQDRDYKRTIEQRYAVLRPYATKFTPLVQRKLYVTEEASHS